VKNNEENKPAGTDTDERLHWLALGALAEEFALNPPLESPQRNG
jgi:hypothetical protein